MIASVQRAVEISEKLARDHPQVTKYQLGLGSNLAALTWGLAADRKFPQADSAGKRSIAVLEKLAADHPHDMNVAEALVKAYRAMAMLRYYRGEPTGQESDRQIQLLRELARRDPRNRWIARRQLWVALASRGESRMRFGRLSEALADFEEVIELTHGTRDEELFRLFRALTKARLGDHSALALLGDQVRDILNEAGKGTKVYYFFMSYYDVACIHAALAQGELRDQGRPPAERQQLADRDLERALEFLDKARAGGEFKGEIHLDEIRRDLTLDPLRLHPRFRDLMMDFAFPDNPFRP
jgi:hypothetical protein